MKKHMSFYAYLLFLAGIFMFSNCERNDEEIFSSIDEANAKSQTNEVISECHQTPVTKLRHVLLFEFNENTSVEVKRGFIQALCAFKDSIDEVKELEWGKNFNLKSKDDFSLCFLLTFYSMDDFLVYLNHSVHLNFISVWLNPNIKDVIAFDYWANDVKSGHNRGHYNHNKYKSIRHLVFYNYKNDLSPDDRNYVIESFANLPKKTHQIQHFEWGSEILLLGLNQEFDDAFLLSFNSIKDYNIYLRHPSTRYFYYKIALPNTEEILTFDYYINRN